MPWEIPKKISLLAVAILFLFTFFTLILDAPRTLYLHYCTLNVHSTHICWPLLSFAVYSSASGPHSGKAPYHSLSTSSFPHLVYSYNWGIVHVAKTGTDSGVIWLHTATCQSNTFTYKVNLRVSLRLKHQCHNDQSIAGVGDVISKLIMPKNHYSKSRALEAVHGSTRGKIRMNARGFGSLPRVLASWLD